MKTFLFDISCAGWAKNYEVNRVFLEMQRRRITERFLARGYVYLNQIYEAFGAEWDPRAENTCWHGRPIFMEFERVGDYDFLVKIY